MLDDHGNIFKNPNKLSLFKTNDFEKLKYLQMSKNIMYFRQSDGNEKFKQIYITKF